MKKTKLIALMLIVTLMFTGAVYAAWSQTVTVRGSINTGMVKIDISEAITSTNMYITSVDDLMRADRLTISEETGAFPDNSIDADRVIGLNLIEFYPGSVAIAKFELQNESTMPVTVSILEEPMLEGFIQDQYELTHLHSGRFEEYGPFDRAGFNAALENLEFEPGDRLELKIQLTMNLNATEELMNESRNDDDNNAYEYEIPFRFDQYNY